MNNLEKIQALREGGWIKACLEGTDWVNNEQECFTDADLYRPRKGKCAHEHALYNAAKVEVTKGVLDELDLAFNIMPIVSQHNTAESFLRAFEVWRDQHKYRALTLLKTLREAL